MTTLILYSTAGCHLCEHAKAIINTDLKDGTFTLREVDIANDDDLFSRYGMHIPVVRNATTGTECFWPFDGAQLQELIGR